MLILINMLRQHRHNIHHISTYLSNDTYLTKVQNMQLHSN
jgi:hypothetical protein